MNDSVLDKGIQSGQILPMTQNTYPLFISSKYSLDNLQMIKQLQLILHLSAEIGIKCYHVGGKRQKWRIYSLGIQKTTYMELGFHSQRIDSQNFTCNHNVLKWMCEFNLLLNLLNLAIQFYKYFASLIKRRAEYFFSFI